MKRLITQILICLTLTAGNGSAVCAQSAKINTPDVVALAAPSTGEMATQKAVLEQKRVLDEQFIPGVAIYASNFSGDEASRLAKDGVYIGDKSKDNFVELQGGNVLLNPENDMTVGTRLGKIYVGAGASVFVVDSGDDVAVYDLLQTKPNQVAVVIIEANKHRVTLEPGRVVVLTGQETNDFEKLEVDCHRVAYRNAQPLDIGNKSSKVKVFAADFSIASALTAIQPLKRLTLSKNREDKIAIERMLKGAVLLGDFATSPGAPGKVDPQTTTVKDESIQTVKADSIQVAAQPAK